MRRRGGRPPSSPRFPYDRRDLKSYTKWARKVEIWKRVVEEFMPSAVAALRLHAALDGAPLEDVEYLEIDRVSYAPHGRPA